MAAFPGPPEGTKLELEQHDPDTCDKASRDTEHLKFMRAALDLVQ